MTGMSAVIGGIAQKATEMAAERPGDFWQDGLLHCGRCGEAKQCYVDFGDGPAKYGCACRCQREADRLEKKKALARERFLAISDLRVQGIQDRAMQEITFERVRQTENIRKCRRYVENWEKNFRNNLGFLMAGLPGRGKTHAAACIANALIDRSVPVLVTSIPKILNSGSWDKKELTDQMKFFDLLVIDDLGTERKERGGMSNGYALEIVQMVIDERYKTKKPLIVTTNFSKAEMDNPANMDYYRIFDRLKEMCVPMHFDGPSWREIIAQEKMRLAREEFG